MIFSVLSAILIIILLIFYVWINRRFYVLYLKLKGPLGLPLVGIAYKFRHMETILIEMNKYREKYGNNYVTWMGSKCFLISSDPDTLEVLFRSPHCYNKTTLYKILNDVLGGGLFTSNGLKWATHSKVMKPAFKRRPILNFYPTFNNESEHFFKIIENLKNNLDGLSLFNYIQMTTLRITFETTLGSDSNIAERNFDTILGIFQKLTESFIKRIYNPLIHSRLLYGLTGDCRETFKTKKILDSFVDKEVVKRQKYFEASSDDSGVEQSESDLEDSACVDKTFLDYIIRRKDKHDFSFRDIRNEVQVLISAGFETTAVGIYSTLIFLATHPEIQEKLFKELVTQFPNKNFVIGEKECRKLVYTEMCINESFRVAPPVPLVGRLVSEDVKLKNGITVPKGTEVIIDIFNMQRCTKIWGKNAVKYDPEHFRPGNYYNKHPYAYLPFTKGGRMCIGFHYAIIMTKIFLAKLIRNYKITTDMNYKDLVFVNKISLKYKHHPNFKIEKRER